MKKLLIPSYMKNKAHYYSVICWVYIKSVTGSNDFIETGHDRGTWVAQSAEHPTLDFSSGHDPRAMGSSPMSDSALNVEPA